MTITVTVKARAVPVTVIDQDTGHETTLEPWQEKPIHIGGSTTLKFTEAEPAADEAPAADVEASDAAVEPEEEADRGYSRSRRKASAADSDETQIG